MSCEECGAEFTPKQSTQRFCCLKCQRDAGNRRNREAQRDWHYRDKYGLSVAEVEALYADQDGRCGCCDRAVSLRTRRGPERACVDHCHATGKVRGILCWDCNVAIGKLGDTYNGVERALRYLSRD
jgi:hypothetical protein